MAQLSEIQLGGKGNWTLHTNATYVINLNPYKSLKYAAFGPLYAGGVSNSFYHLTVYKILYLFTLGYSIAQFAGSYPQAKLNRRCQDQVEWREREVGIGWDGWVVIYAHLLFR